jgi:hypothetical protein
MPPGHGLATRAAIRLEHRMQLNQGVRIVLTPSASVTDHCGKIGNADHMAILQSEIRDPLGTQEAHVALRTWWQGSLSLGHHLCEGDFSLSRDRDYFAC